MVIGFDLTLAIEIKSSPVNTKFIQQKLHYYFNNNTATHC